VCLSTAHARFDAGAHDWPHRHAAATRTIRQTPPPAPAVQCMCPPPRPPSWPAAARGTALLFSPVSPAPRRRRRRSHRLTDSLSAASLQDTILPPGQHHQALSLTPSGAPGLMRQLHFGLQLCHTVAALPAWYYTPRMHACTLLCRPLADRHRHSLDGPVVRILRGLSRAFLALSRLPAAPALLAAPLAAVRDRESWAHIRPSAIPDLPFLQAEWS
jgi:hypothetical protein